MAKFLTRRRKEGKERERDRDRERKKNKERKEDIPVQTVRAEARDEF